MGDPILDAADPSSALWWQRYSARETGDFRSELRWTTWLRSCVQVQKKPARLLYKSAKRLRTWSDIQVLAWTSSGDGYFVSKVGGIGRDDGHNQEQLRAEALRYLSFHVGMKYCRCGAEEPELCRCLEIACTELVAALREERLHAFLLRENGTDRRLSPAEIRSAPLDAAANALQFIDEPGELLFDESEVRSTLKK
jgi:hypothetical protein